MVKTTNDPKSQVVWILCIWCSLRLLWQSRLLSLSLSGSGSGGCIVAVTSRQQPTAGPRFGARAEQGEQTCSRFTDLAAPGPLQIFYTTDTKYFFIIDTKSDFSYVYRNWLSRRTTFSKLWWSGNKTSVSELFRLMMNDQVEWNEMNTAISNHASKTEGVKWGGKDRDVLPHAGGLPAHQDRVQSVPLHRAHAHRGRDSLQYQVNTRTPGLNSLNIGVRLCLGSGNIFIDHWRAHYRGLCHLHTHYHSPDRTWD